MPELLKIEVAQYCVGLRIKEAFLFEEAACAYTAFLSDAPCDLIIDVELSGDAPPEDFPFAQLSFKDNKIINIQDDRLSGTLDLLKKYGEVKINPVRNSPVSLLYPLGTFLRNTYTLLVALGGKGVALHAVGVVKDEEVYIFIGPSKAGKSTVARLSQDKVVLSDDLIMIKKVDSEFKVFPAPYWGDKQIGPRRNAPYRINSMFKLIKDTQVFLERLSSGCAIADIFTTPHIPMEFIPGDELLSTFSELICAVPYYGLHFLPEPSFWDCIERERIKNGVEGKNSCKVR
jgi:hypothetical protein